ncbi:hypothetical protein P153DRAFT_105302 [Dothidotthia symphoricarpi CBS 119687]|uniref:Telomerase reverse transcriptase n=1 Tax=Dothidotthia symphoricarpi CBS 119687 TaxID=1392245 RepID=A0A6A6ASF2_9PLEO|nr:uncharacterized protein P153DRAFT_105302 [Dothidotthia symphoricarpi CBS 119687]KAF2134143.1 hypothetical protein P153DRAFT_105302 [Dothidotthia symphoricarpi CBS 119687]
MFIDTSLNSMAKILANLYQSFYEAAARCLEYVRALAKVRTACSSLLIKTVDNIIALAFVMLQRRSRSRSIQSGGQPLQSAVSRRHVMWLACRAFQTVFQRRQTKHCVLLKWLGGELRKARFSSEMERGVLESACAWGR